MDCLEIQLLFCAFFVETVWGVVYDVETIGSILNNWTALSTKLPSA